MVVMSNKYFEKFFYKLWNINSTLIDTNNHNTLIDVHNLNFRILNAIIFQGMHQIARGNEITFNFSQIRELLGLEDSVYTYHQIEQAIFYFKGNLLKYKHANNYTQFFNVINTIRKPINDIYFEKEWSVGIDGIFKEKILLSYLYDLTCENDELYCKNEKSFECESNASEKILIPNQFFSYIASLSYGAVKLYFSIILQEHLTRKEKWEIDEIIKFANVSKAAFYRFMNNLVQLDLIKKHKGNRSTQQKSVYIINKNPKSNDGYTPFKIETINFMLNNAEDKLTFKLIKLYPFLVYLEGGEY